MNALKFKIHIFLYYTINRLLDRLHLGKSSFLMPASSVYKTKNVCFFFHLKHFVNLLFNELIQIYLNLVMKKHCLCFLTLT